SQAVRKRIKGFHHRGHRGAQGQPRFDIPPFASVSSVVGVIDVFRTRPSKDEVTLVFVVYPEVLTHDSRYGRGPAGRLAFGFKGETSMAQPEKLGEAVKLYGYSKKKKIKLYGKELELESDPVNRQEDDVFVEAREKGSNQVKAVQVPRNVVE